MPIAQINGIDLFYTIQGTGEPLVLIAGFNSDKSCWAAMMPFLVKHYQVIRFDNPGVGQSSALQHPYSIQQMAADTAALLDHLGIFKAHIAGHSMGGQIAQELALSYPQKVKTLLLLSSWARGDSKFHALMELFGDLPLQLDPILYQKTILPWLFTEAFYISGTIDQLLQVLQVYPYLPSPQSLYHQSRAILNGDTIDRLANIPHPTLVMVTKGDLVTPVKFSEQLVQGIPNASLIVLDQGGHAFIVEIAEVVATEILTFLTTSG